MHLVALGALTRFARPVHFEMNEWMDGWTLRTQRRCSFLPAMRHG